MLCCDWPRRKGEQSGMGLLSCDWSPREGEGSGVGVLFCDWSRIEVGGASCDVRGSVVGVLKWDAIY